MPPKPWSTRSSRRIYQNNWMSLREDIAVLPDGRTTIYGVATMGECVGVLPFVDQDTVLLVRQYRYVQRENFRWEMPTGGMKPVERPEQAAQRELAEEAGYRAARLVPINTYYTSKSVCDETAHLFCGYDLTRFKVPENDTVSFEIASFSFAEVLRMVQCSDIRDGMTVIAVLRAALIRAGIEKAAIGD